MSEMIDGYTAQKIKDFWINANLSDHGTCMEITVLRGETIRSLLSKVEVLEKENDACRGSIELHQSGIKQQEQIIKYLEKQVEELSSAKRELLEGLRRAGMGLHEAVIERNAPCFRWPYDEAVKLIEKHTAERTEK